MLKEVAASGGKSNVIVASHNEESVVRAMSKMKSLGILPTDNTVVFGQIYGMAFNITMKLGGRLVFDFTIDQPSLSSL